jgi:hypothetical protein
LGIWALALKLTGNLMPINREFNQGIVHAAPPN